MQGLNDTIKTSIAAVLLALAFVLCLYRIDDPWGLGLACLVAGIVVLRPMPRFSLIDAILVAIWAYGLVSLTCRGMYGAFLYRYTAPLAAYFLFRHLLQSGGAGLFMRLLIVPVTVAIIIGLVSFVVFYTSVHDAGFDNVYPFRFLFRPLGYLVNVWAFVCLALSALTFIAGMRDDKLRWVFFVLSFFCSAMVLLTFSRGAYIAWGLGVLVFASILVGMRRKLVFIAACALLSMAVWTILPQEFVTTCSMDKTASQKMSMESRMDSTTEAIDAVRGHAWFGSGSYAMVMDKALSQDSTRSYTSYAPNTLVLVLVEQGLFGIMLYLVLFFAIVVRCLRRRREATIVLAGSALFVVSVKDMTMSVMLSDGLSSVLVYMLLALLHDGSEYRRPQSGANKFAHRVIVVAGCACVLFSIANTLRVSHLARLNDDAISLAKRGEWAKSLEAFDALPQQLPFLINKATVAMLAPDGALSDECVCDARRAIAMAQDKSPDDVFLQYVSAKLSLRARCDDEAEAMFHSLVAEYPRNAVYLYSFAEFLNNSGRASAAAAYMERAVMLMPRLAGTKLAEELMHAVPSMRDDLSAKLRSAVLHGASPDMMARFGYMAFVLRQYGYAESLLLAAVSEHPSYSSPYLVLAKLYECCGDASKAAECLSKYRLLTVGAFSNADVPQSAMSAEKQSVAGLLYGDYSMKYQSWYGFRSLFGSVCR